MTKVTVKSPANIAFIKYWGKKDAKLNIPFNDSISMNLSNCYTKMTVTFDPKFKYDIVTINGSKVQGNKRRRVVDVLNVVRVKAKIKTKAKVESENNFPIGSGIASSASAFSALVLAGSKAAGLNLTKKELSIMARLGSGSACRSIIGGFSYWKKGNNSENSYAIQLAPANYWEIRDITVIVDRGEKKNSSTEGHSGALSSPYFEARLKYLIKRVKKMKQAIINRNFKEFGELLEEEAIDLHTIAMTSKPPIFYWNGGTIETMTKIREWRNEGLLAFYTMDAGANIHIICQTKDEIELKTRLNRLPYVQSLIINRPDQGTIVI